jgi:ribonuclease-3
LGDSVLGLIISDSLYKSLRGYSEGDMAKVKSFVVSESSLAKIAAQLRVENYVLIGKGEEYSGGRTKKAILADCVEAIIGAYYLDSGFRAVKSFVQRLFMPEIEAVLSDRHEKDYKTLLQELAQKKHKTYPKYRVVKKKGPNHDRTFWIEVDVNGKAFGPGRGKNKKEAEQEAAGMAYKALKKTSKPLPT